MGSASAQVFFHESFNDVNLGQITPDHGNVDGTGLMSSHFEIVSPAPSLYYQVRGGDEIHGGHGALKLTTAPEPVANSFVRYSIPPVGTDFSLSFLCRVPEKGVGSDTFRIQLMKDNEVGFSFVLKPFDHPDFLLWYGRETGGTVSPSPDGHTFLFVLKCAGNRAEYYVDPKLSNLSYKGSSGMGSIQASEINGIRFSVESSDLAGPATTILIDELRLSYTLVGSISSIIAEPNPSEVEILKGQIAALNTLVGEKNAKIAAQESTIESLEAERDAAFVERDSRPTLQEVQDARTGSVVLTSDEIGLVRLRFDIEESTDLRIWQKKGISLETELLLPEDKKFLRISVRK